MVFGNGGAARAVVYALLNTVHPSVLYLVGRNADRVAILAEAMQRFDPNETLRIVPMNEAGAAVKTSRLLVNATPLGMHPHEAATPWADRADFGPHSFGYDLVYNPQETQFMRDVASKGGQVLGGLEMLVQQAAASYQQWTHRPMPVEAVREALQRTLFSVEDK